MPSHGLRLNLTSAFESDNKYSCNDSFSDNNGSLPVTMQSSSLTTATDGHNRSQELYSAPSEGAVIAILCFSFLVFICGCLVLLLTRWTSTGQNATLVLLRSLYLSDLLMSLYAMSKMSMLLFLDRLKINFFLPESLFFTATFASTLSIVSLNVDCFIKFNRPHTYAQVDKDNVITSMLLVWNAAFIVGFLPLMGWNQGEDTVNFFNFFPWHYLLFNGCIIAVCVLVCVASMVTLRRLNTLSQFSPDCFSSETLKFCKYKNIHRTIVIESVMWLCCYVPFFVYIALTCTQCLLSEYPSRDSTIICFIPLFVLKSLLSSVSQAARTHRLHAVMKKFSFDTSVLTYLRGYICEKMCLRKDDELPAISFSNPVCEYQIQVTREMEHNRLVMNHNLNVLNFARLGHASDINSSIHDSNDSLTGIANCSYRPSLDFGRVLSNDMQHTTAL